MNDRPLMLTLAGSASLLGFLALSGCATGNAADSSIGQAAPSAAPAAAVHDDVSPAQARALLVEGNARFAAGHNVHPHQTPDRRAELAETQHPFAVILGCADSRTSPEILFDQGIGDLFVVREAGNIIDDHTTGSIEYAVEHLHAKLVVVMGHQRCGAVAAAIETLAAHGHADGHIDSLVASIRPAVEATAGQDADATCRANVVDMVRDLRASEPLLHELVQNGKLAIVGAYYSIDTGVVTFLEDK